jgi:hypothetical protein
VVNHDAVSNLDDSMADTRMEPGSGAVGASHKTLRYRPYLRMQYAMETGGALEVQRRYNLARK